MKIIDFSALNILLFPSLFIVSILCIIKYPADLVVLAIPLTIIFLYSVLDLRYYYVDEHGITLFMLFGICKIHFCWSEIKTLSINKMKGGPRRGALDILVLHLASPSSTASCDKIRGALWYYLRFKSIVMFRYSFERYKYIRQFCDLPLVDNR